MNRILLSVATLALGLGITGPALAQHHHGHGHAHGGGQPYYGGHAYYGGYGYYGHHHHVYPYVGFALGAYPGYLYGGYGGYYASPYYAYAPYYYSGPSVYVTPGSYAGGYVVQPQTPAATGIVNDACMVEVRLPAADAELVVNGHRTTSVGSVRHFESSGLSPGRTYDYTLTATWNQGGQPVKDVRKVSVMPGRQTIVDFTRRVAPERIPAPTGSGQSP